MNINARGNALPNYHSIIKKIFLREEVSILRPLGYGPNTLPLRHPAMNTSYNFVYIKTKCYNVL